MIQARASTWVEISHAALAANYRAVAAHAGVAVCAVVKANAYGHGIVETARTLQQEGARWLAVTRVEEARALRSAGITGKVLILTPPPTPALTTEAIRLDCSVTVSSAADLDRFEQAARAASKHAAVHVKIDTGMGRLGIDTRSAPQVVTAVAASEQVTLEGIFTHFADSASPQGAGQLARFHQVLSELGKHRARTITHASNSAALIALPDARFDMVRVGTLLYGQNPPGATAPFPLQETFTWYSAVAAVRTVAAGETIGYGSEWIAKKATRVATLPIGWADGFTAEPGARTPTIAGAALSSAKALARVAKGSADPRAVWFGSSRAQVLGRVGMQTTTVDVSGLPDVIVGSVARIPARRLLVAGAIERHFI